jgi:hypothetical protein
MIAYNGEKIERVHTDRKTWILSKFYARQGKNLQEYSPFSKIFNAVWRKICQKTIVRVSVNTLYSRAS